jgi:adenylate kinase family enzyme
MMGFRRNREGHETGCQRIVVFGNGGAGKSWLSRQLSATFGAPLVALDDLYWQPGRYGIARDKQLVAEMVRSEAQAESWIIEGVYGWLADIALPRATALIWLDIAEAECIDNIKKRGIQGGETQEAFEELIVWVGRYRIRKTANSHHAHAQSFAQFAGPKLQLCSRNKIAAFVAEISN